MAGVIWRLPAEHAAVHLARSRDANGVARIVLEVSVSLVHQLEIAAAARERRGARGAAA